MLIYESDQTNNKLSQLAVARRKSTREEALPTRETTEQLVETSSEDCPADLCRVWKYAPNNLTNIFGSCLRHVVLARARSTPDKGAGPIHQQVAARFWICSLPMPLKFRKKWN